MQSRILIFLVIIAVIFAIFFFLLISFLTGGGEDTPDGGVADVPAGDGGVAPVGQPFDIDGVTVFLVGPPERSVSLKSDIAPPPTQPPVLDVTPFPTDTPPVLAPIETATTAPPPVVSDPGGNQVTIIDYTVQPGDTLYSIASAQRTSIELMAVHGISSEDLVPGTVIRLPIANPTYCVAGTQPYVVRPGDNVFRIAQQFNTTTQAIQQANNLGPDFRINVAQVLCIP